MCDIGDNMADPMKAFQSTQFGQIDPFSPRASELARLYSGGNAGGWPDVRQSIAEYRTGQGQGPSASKLPKYKEKSPEEQLLMTWLMESLMYGQPSGDLGVTEKTKTYTGDPLLNKAKELAGGG